MYVFSVLYLCERDISINKNKKNEMIKNERLWASRWHQYDPFGYLLLACKRSAITKSFLISSLAASRSDDQIV